MKRTVEAITEGGVLPGIEAFWVNATTRKVKLCRDDEAHITCFKSKAHTFEPIYDKGWVRGVFVPREKGFAFSYKRNLSSRELRAFVEAYFKKEKKFISQVHKGEFTVFDQLGGGDLQFSLDTVMRNGVSWIDTTYFHASKHKLSRVREETTFMQLVKDRLREGF